jgi:peptidoglycan-N-acetylglucosamine deacetylase
METDSDDDGDTSTHLFTRLFLITIFSFPLAAVRPLSEKSSPHKSNTGHILAAAASPKKHVKPKSNKKKLYITFDDGPNRGTKNVFTIVQNEQVPVSFFIVGEHVFASYKQGQLWDSLRMAQQIELCNHSFSHAHCHYDKYYQSPDSVVCDFKRTQDSLHFSNPIARAPGRNIWRVDTLQFTDIKKSAVAADSLQKAGFVLMGWDLEWEFDHKTMSVNESAEKMVAAIDSTFKHRRTKSSDHLVLLAHDQAYVKTDDSIQLVQFFQLLKEKDEYELSLVSDYPGADTAMRDSPLH